MADKPVQDCKYCGQRATGEPALGAGAGFVAEGGALSPVTPFAWRFECHGAGRHGDDDSGRVWYWTAPDVAKEEQQYVR